MSLINKMLQDLEARQETAPSVGTPAYQHLRPVREDRRRILRPVLAVLAGILIVAAALYAASERMGISIGLTPAAKVAESAPRASARSAAPSRAPAPAPNAPAAATAPSVPEAQTPATSATAPSVERTVVATAAPVPPATPPAADAVTMPPAPSGSQKSADVRIVKPKATKPAPAHTGERNRVETKAPPREAVASTGESAAVVDKKVRPFTAEEKAEAGYRRAVRFLDQSRPDDAKRELRTALVDQPKHVKARELAAAIALQTGHWREAQNLLEEGLRQVPNHYLFARLLARVYVDHGAEAKALAVLESALPTGSDDAEFCALLGLLYQRAGRHADAVKTYERALTLNPADARTWLGFAISLEASEQWGAAKNAYLRAQQVGLAPTLARYAEQRLTTLKDR